MTEAPVKTHDSTVVSVTGDKLTTTCSQGKQHCHTIAKAPSYHAMAMPARLRTSKPEHRSM